MKDRYFTGTLKGKTMRRWITLAFLFFPCFVMAQGELALIDFKIKKPNRVDVVNLSDNRYVFCFLNNKQLQLTTVNSNYSFSSAAFNLDKTLYHSQYLRSIRNSQYHTVYFYHERDKHIQAFKIDLAMGTTQTFSCGIIPKEEDFLTHFQLNGKMYLITVSKAVSVLHLWESQDGGDFVKTSFNAGHPSLYNVFLAREEDLNEAKYSDIGIDKISYQLENNLKSAHAVNKLYLVDGKIIITLDEPDNIWLYTIDPATKNMDEKKLSFKLEKGEGREGKQGNSFLYLHQLFRVTINDEMMNLVMINTDSMSMQWNENIYRDLPILIKNGPILSESSGSDPKVLAKTAQYFGRVQNGHIAIAVNEINGQYLLQIGSYQLMQSYSPYGPASGGGGSRVSIGVGMGMGMGMGFGGMGFGGMGMGYPMGGYGGYGWGMPGYYYGYPGYYPSSMYTYVESTYFYSLMDASSLQHLELAPPQTLREKLNDYENQRFKSNIPDLIAVVPLPNQSILLGYYFKNAHKYQLVEIK